METWVKHSVALSVAAAILLGIAAGPLFGLTSSGPEVLLGGVLMGGGGLCLSPGADGCEHYFPVL